MWIWRRDGPALFGLAHASRLRTRTRALLARDAWVWLELGQSPSPDLGYAILLPNLFCACHGFLIVLHKPKLYEV